MNIPKGVMSQIKKNPTDNDFFYHAEDAFRSLQQVYKNETLFSYDHVGMVVNTLERYYKGFLQSQIENNDYQMITELELKADHDLFKLAEHINHIVPGFLEFANRTEYRENKAFYFNLRHMYTASRYEEYPTFKEFQQLYEFTEHQKNILLEALQEKQLSSVYDIDTAKLDDDTR